jgi:hypothetical protein
MSQDNQNRNPRRDDDRDQLNREGRADLPDTDRVQGGSTGQDQSQDEDTDEMDEDREEDDRPEGGNNRRRSIS